MDIHKPKAAHSWREFLIEIGTIICGILIALLLEQGVEWLHGRHLAEQSEEHLSASLQADLVNAAEWISIEPCLWGRATDLVNELKKPAGPWKANRQWLPEEVRVRLERQPIPIVLGAPGRIWPLIGWEEAVSSGALRQLPRERVDAYSEVYHLSEFSRGRQSEVQMLLSKLGPLGFDRNLSEAERTAFIGEISEALRAVNGMVSSGRVILRDAHAIGIDPDPKTLSERLAEEVHSRGSCVQPVKLPLPPAQ